MRGTPQQIIEKYNQLHRDAQLSGDRVNAENHAQHAEHYLRLLAEATREVDKARDEQEEQNRQRQAERDRERNDRLKAQEAAAADPSTLDQPVADDSTGQDSGLVETPETAQQNPDPKPEPKPRKPRQPRKPRAPKVDESDSGPQARDTSPPAPEAAE